MRMKRCRFWARIRPQKRRIKSPERRGCPQKRQEGKVGGGEEKGEVRRRRRELRFPPSVKTNSERL